MKQNDKVTIIMLLGTIGVAFFALVGLYLNKYIPAARSAFASIILFQCIILYRAKRK